MTVTYLWLTCADCERRVQETWDGRCEACFYIYTGGDLGEDDWWSTHAVCRDGSISLEYK